MISTHSQIGTAFLAALLGIAGCSKDKTDAAAPPAPPSAASVAAVASIPPSAALPASAAPAESAPAPVKGLLRKLVWTEKCDEEKAYVDCVVAACASNYKDCYGPGLDDGTVAGPCKAHGDCSVGCLAVGDEIERAACLQDCADRTKTDKDPCGKCLARLDKCTEKAGCQFPSRCKKK